MRHSDENLLSGGAIPPPAFEALPRAEGGICDVLRQLVEQHPNFLSRTYTHCIDAVESFGAPTDLSIHGLSEWQRQARTSPEAPHMKLAKVTQSLPPRVVEQALGRPLLLFAASQGAEPIPHTDTVYSYLGETGDSAFMLRQAVDAERVLGGAKRDLAVILRQYELLQILGQRPPLQLESTALLQRHRATADELTPQRLAGYSLAPLTLLLDDPIASGPHATWEERVFPSTKGPVVFPVYLDAPTGLLLLHEGRPCALIAFHAGTDDTLVVNQIQGVQGRRSDEHGDPCKGADGKPLFVKSRALAVLRFEDALVEAATLLAKSLSFQSIAVQAGADNKWVKRRWADGAPHLALAKAVRRYDETAKRCGFEPPGEHSNLWKKHLHSLSRG